MSSLFQSTRNTRAILPESLRFIRSDVPEKITADETRWLIANNVRTIVDLREKDEQAKKVCPLQSNDLFTYISTPVTGGNAVPECTDDVPLSYIRMADGQMNKIIDTIMNAENNVLFFCNAGKDRTGVVSAIILHRLGADDEYIINDYMLSADNLKEMLQAYAEQNPEIDINVITPKREYMEKFLAWLRSGAGST
ncbi:tyrosine-protein phosphatase [Huintestinicola sp.]|uniref:tyrosine-protein phosphatase n=1 Tax=Huintestinicola sp. TaxID=2981661 RepID=UPI003D7EF450